MFPLTVAIFLVGVFVGRTMTAYGVVPISCAACLTAGLMSDFSLIGVLWRVMLLVFAVQAGFVAGAASFAIIAGLRNSLTRVTRRRAAL